MSFQCVIVIDVQKRIFCLIHYFQVHYLRQINIHLTTISLLNLHIFKLHEKLFFAVDFRSSNRSLATRFCQFSTITATTMSDICFHFLSDLPQLFRHLRHLAFLLHIIKIRQNQNLVKSVIKLGAMAILELVTTNKLKN